MVRGVDELRFRNRSVVQPEDNVAVLAIIDEIGAGDGDWFVGVGREDGEGAGRIETDALDVARVYV